MSQPVNYMINTGIVRLNVFEWGSNSKPLLVMLHGLASTSHMFDLVAPLLAADYHVVTYDQRGHGLSEKAPFGYDFESIARDLDSLFEPLKLKDEPFTLAGHSWGAWTTLYYAATRPQRIEKAILIDGALGSVREDFQSLEDMAPPEHDHWPIDEVKKMIREEWLGEAYRPKLENLALSIYDTSKPDDVQPHLKLAQHMQIAKALWNFNALDYFPRVQAPTLAVMALAGDKPNVRQQHDADVAKAQMKDLTLAWMPNTIHDIPWHRPQELASLMRDFTKEE